MRLRTTFFSLILISLLAVPSAKAQDGVIAAFQEGKAMFDRGEYALAVAKLAPITSISQDNDMVRYASFYYAVSAYRSNDAGMAKNIFLQINQRFPGWDKQDEVKYWLGKLSFEEQNYVQAISHLNGIGSSQFDEQIQQLKNFHFAQITDETQLATLLEQNPDQQVLASQLANQILKKDFADQDIDQLNQLATDYELNLDLGIDGIGSSPKKEIYNVGLFLPFSFRDDSVRLERLTQEWTVRFYEGMKLAVDKLSDEGMGVNLVTFDTRSSTASLTSMLQSEDAKSLDLIVGPVFQRAVLEVSAFAKENKINMINPLSSNGEVIKDNPFAFLYYPSNESLAMVAAEYARKHFTENKNVAVFYSGFGDLPRAELYKDILEKDSFNITIFKRVRPQESSLIQQLFVEEEEVPKDSAVVAEMMAEMDSLQEAGVEDWQLYDERDFVYDTLRILPDSIGHIYVASDVASLAASTVSAIDARPDTIFYLSSSRWLASEQSINFGQLERIDAIFTGSNWIDYDTDAVQEFRERYQLNYNAFPRKVERLGDPYLGYDILLTYGRLMYEYGKYFQVGLKRKKDIEGALTKSFDYRFSNDNRYIPIFRVTDSQVVEIKEIPESNDQN